MQQAYLYIYFILLLAALILCIIVIKKEQGFSSLALLLLFSIITEIGAEICKQYKQNYYFLYHIFTLFEYSFIAFYLSKYQKSVLIKKIISISIPFFIVSSLLLSIFIVRINEYPGLQYNLEGVLLILWSLVSLFSFTPVNNDPLYKQSSFWIASGFFIFYVGIFFVNGVFNYFFSKSDPNVKILHTVINTIFNYTLYIFMIIGFLCSLKKGK